MAKYKVKDINKNGEIDGWEQAKYDAINKSSDSPAKQVVDPTMQQQMVQPMTNIPPAASSLVNPFSPQAQANAQCIFSKHIYHVLTFFIFFLLVKILI